MFRDTLRNISTNGEILVFRPTMSEISEKSYGDCRKFEEEEEECNTNDDFAVDETNNTSIEPLVRK